LASDFRFIENIQEELDAPNEFWYDPVPHQLYYIPNGASRTAFV
jgi:hypothetical protein